MSEIIFPVQPQPTGTEYTFDGKTWIWNGYAWDFIGASYPPAYSSMMFSHGPIDPVDNQTYIFGDITDDFPITSVENQGKVICLYDGFVDDCSVMIHPGSTGSSELSTFYLINETQSDSVFGTFELSHSDNTIELKDIDPIRVYAGDVFYFRWDTPIWTTNPLQVRTRIEVKIKLLTNG